MQQEIARLQAEASSTVLIRQQVQGMIEKGLITQDESGNIVAVDNPVERENIRQGFESASKQKEPSQKDPGDLLEEEMEEDQIVS